MFRINEVLQHEKKLLRVLSLDDEQVVWIDVQDSKALPAVVFFRDLQKAMDDEALVRAKDPYEALAFAAPEKGSIAQVKRDKNYELVRAIVSDPLFYDPKVRGAKINELVTSRGVSKSNLYKLLRRYWQRGQTPNALLPHYKNSGGKGKKRKANGKKLGRPRTVSPGIGALIDEETERLFRIAIDKHFLTDKGNDLPYVYRRFVTLFKNYFPDAEDSELPTKWQLQHFYNREYSLTKKIKKRTRRIKYDKDVRQLSSTATAHTLGPGSRYEIDATIADIYVLSDSERRDIVGRPVIYFVKDVFSRMITGFYVGLENASYVAAIQALTMAMTDKVQLCSEYGVDIREEDWPTVGLPNAILADRGELLGHQIESLESSFSVRVENTPPYRGDAKGIVERSFRTIQADFKKYAPGAVEETTIKKRGGRDYRLDAKFTIREFKEIILRSILMHNQFDVLEKYDREIDMPDDLEMTPLSIWNWGIQHRTGRLRVASEEAIRISLLPRAKASISDLGISVFGVYYTCSEIVESGLLHRSQKTRRPVGLEAAYDPASADTIYLFPSKGTSEYWTCNLTPRSREYAGASFWDVWRRKKKQKRKTAKSRQRQTEEKRQFEEFLNEKIIEVESQTPKTHHRSDAERVRGIRSNRENEKKRERQQRSQKDKPKEPAANAKTIPFKGNVVEDYEYPDLIDELFDSEDS